MISPTSSNLVSSSTSARGNTGFHFCTAEEYFKNRPEPYDSCHSSLDELMAVRQAAVGNDPESCYPWDSESIRFSDQLITGNILTCSAGGLTDMKRYITFHLLPQSRNLNDVRSTQSAITGTLHKFLEDLNIEQTSGLVIGGDVSLTEHAENSRLLFRQTLGILTISGIQGISYFWGQRLDDDPRGIEAYYSASENAWKLLKYKSGSSDAVNTLSDLLETFSELRVSPSGFIYLFDYPSGLSGECFNRLVSEYRLKRKDEDDSTCF